MDSRMGLVPRRRLHQNGLGHTHGPWRGVGRERQRRHGSGGPGFQAGVFVFWAWPLPVRSRGTVGRSRREEAPVGDTEAAGLGTSKAATAWQRERYKRQT